jgi:hypothetical protein
VSLIILFGQSPWHAAVECDISFSLGYVADTSSLAPGLALAANSGGQFHSHAERPLLWGQGKSQCSSTAVQFLQQGPLRYRWTTPFEKKELIGIRIKPLGLMWANHTGRLTNHCYNLSEHTIICSRLSHAMLGHIR